ncbi:hypothetical protein [Hymenobacter sp. BT190]|uniref:hypothetical protein n=1 Tax=Hymenobacter sp. BT190 TaxID=2763505 RepID=UPI0016510200|nr:hypothetical protein [Hymenobacter sp. BT190]MBC6699204.1 hypothetical protein [Hymenobacter sp. BT190]
MKVSVTELSWADVKRYIYASDSSLPDTYVLDTTRDDWRKWVDFVNATYKVMFRDAHEQEHERIDFTAVLKCWNDNEADGWPFASISVGEVQINCFFLAEDIIDGDIDPKQFKQPEDHSQLMNYLTTLSTMFGKQVVMLSEGTRFEDNNRFDPEPLIIIEKGNIWANAYWLD